ncbi:response regulator [Rhizobium leguminosarum]|uniref:ATP-binding response regulator n=1 Tax=Rhizobium leguminosarum TaxID=384 RepID=UPI001C939081|nr:ATP-binding protein [Rhizobium leguminosarum]MBY5399470.1 response regulator [Rhizobium leguminosarum]
MIQAKILIVEDDRVVARDIEQQLTRLGHHVVARAASFDEAISRAATLRPDIVLMDIRIEGEQDGIEAAQEMRARFRIPVVFLTAYADRETVERASTTEPFGYLLKPFEDSQLGTVIEIALYKHAAERRLYESERRFAATLSSIGDAVIATDDLGKINFINAVAERLTGWPVAEAVGRHLDDVFVIVDEETRAKVASPVDLVLGTGEMAALAKDTLLISREKHEIPIDDCASPIISADGEMIGAVLVFRDMAERLTMEEALRKAQAELTRMSRLSAVATMTVSIAHEINQPLMAIVTNAASCLSWLDAPVPDLDEARLAATRIIEDGHRAGNVLGGIRALAKNSPIKMAPVILDEVVEEVLALIRTELRSRRVVTETDFLAPSPLAHGDKVQLQQVVLNLVLNAAEAMNGNDGRRIIRIRTFVDETGSTCLSIADDGPGVDQEIEQRIFEPFFTTKPDGIGVGLAICRSIIEAHGGQLRVIPGATRGATFEFSIPAANEAIDRPKARSVSPFS